MNQFCILLSTWCYLVAANLCSRRLEASIQKNEIWMDGAPGCHLAIMPVLLDPESFHYPNRGLC